MEDHASGMDYQPKSRPPQEVLTEVKSLSSGLYDILHVRGKTTAPGPMASNCKSDDNEEGSLQIVRHPWSLYGVNNASLQKGMSNLARELPKRGWKIVKNGPNRSEARTLEILAVHMKTRTQMHAEWLRGLDAGTEPLIAFDVYSRCFKPE
ncbi:hypothetical protein HUT18_23340 [Streptomyces sp. NA04227]|uniref:hypothetical protein n=1 Tax=Streptomyces sp. NA04227 TaxID=2742136 RepID=UPI0015900AD8|nr:hypothetical protein [Streptomyces sp. NA04227]QKW08874.1 hypothetical protein HUT18_23340 [Streptomyces sp. NA04227]